jgi:ribosomal protein S18 acetylase RimI-like enzyme
MPGNSPELSFRSATAADLPIIVRMLADDDLGGTRESVSDPLPASYYEALESIRLDPNNDVLVACLGDQVVGTLQLTFTPSLSYRGGWRATIESVRTEAALRGQGIGAALVQYAIERARERGCVLIQLSSHASRTAAQRFYERLGFARSHIGMKLSLPHAHD